MENCENNRRHSIVYQNNGRGRSGRDISSRSSGSSRISGSNSCKRNIVVITVIIKVLVVLVIVEQC